MRTDFDTLKQLAAYTLNHLTENKMVEFNVTLRLDLVDAMATEFGVSFATDEDIKDQAIEDCLEGCYDHSEQMDVEFVEVDCVNEVKDD